MKLHGPQLLWIEFWHGILLLALFALLVPLRVLEPWGLLIGGLFMGLNFLLLGYGIRWVLTPFAGKGRVRAGIFLLLLKFGLFLALLGAIFFRIQLDAVSFAAGVTCLLVAIVMAGFWFPQWKGE